MRIYILTEDSKSFPAILPAWLRVLAPGYKEVGIRDIAQMPQNSYVIFGAGGNPKILKVLREEAIETVNANGLDMLVICLDGDDDGVAAKTLEVAETIANSPVKLNCGYKVLVSDKCVETWLLGNSTLYRARPTHAFARFFNHYNARQNDPELMEKFADYKNSNALFHELYLRRLLREKLMKTRVTYTKSKPPEEIKDKTYLAELLARTEKTNHLRSFKAFAEFFAGV